MLTVCLNMIVKNESKIIERCLNSVKDYIDYFVICDTGSNDGTQQIIKDFFAKHNIPGELHERPWVNFGVNRTEALKLAKGKSDYILLIDADMQLIINDPDWKNKIPYDTCKIAQENDALVYDNVRLINGKKNYSYASVTHEFIQCDEAHTEGKFDLISMDDYADGGCRPDKFKRDIKLLKGALIKEPNNARYAFYLANSYREYGNMKDAIIWYRKRIEMGGWKDEVFVSMLYIGRCYQSGDNWPKALQAYNKAFDYHPERAEPIYEMAKYCREKDMPRMGYQYAKMGVGIPFPKDDVLFIEKNVYDHLLKYELSICACYANNLKLGRSLCDELIFSQNTPQYIKDNCNGNMFFYLEKLQGIISVEELSATKTEDNYHFCNPSIINSEKHGILINLREVSYTFDIDKNIYHFDKTIDTYNHLIDLNTNKETLIDQITKGESIQTHDNYITGLEDLRLFEMEGDLWAIGTCRITNPEGINEMVAIRIEADGSISKAVRLKGIGDSICQKNWVPFNYNGSIHFLYSSSPFILLKPDFETGICVPVVAKTTKLRLDSFRGSSQVISFDEGYLYIVHEVIHKDNRRYYYHRFVYLNQELDIVKMSEPFYFIAKTIEYCAGVCQAGDELYITLGYEDKKAFLIKISIEKIRSSLLSI